MFYIQFFKKIILKLNNQLQKTRKDMLSTRKSKQNWKKKEETKIKGCFLIELKSLGVHNLYYVD